MWDVRWYNPSTCVMVGGSMSGKTTLCLNVLRHAKEIFHDPRCAQNILFHYKQWQDSYEEISKENIITEWIPNLPTIDSILNKCMLYTHSGGSIIVIDDFGNQLTRDVQELFSIYAHHTQSIVILLTQNLFPKNQFYRDISLNATYIILFKNIRDKSQIMYYLRQLQPGKSQWLFEAFEDCTKDPYTHMLFDMHQLQKDHLRIRGNITPNNKLTTVWTEKKCLI